MTLASYYNSGTHDTAAALVALHKALQLDPKRSDSYLSLGMLEAQEQQWAEAEANLKKAVELNPKSTDARVALGNFYQSRGRFPEAEQTFRQGIQNAPARIQLHDFLWRAYSWRKISWARRRIISASRRKTFRKTRSATACWGISTFPQTRSIKRSRNTPRLYKDHARDPVVKRNYIQLLIMKDHLDEATKLNDEILKAQPGDSDAQIYKAQIEIHGGKANAAVDTLQNVLKSDSDNAVAHYQLGLAFDQVGNMSRAESEWREAVRLRPGIVEAHRALAGSAIARATPQCWPRKQTRLSHCSPEHPMAICCVPLPKLIGANMDLRNNILKESIQKDPTNAAAYVQYGNLRMAQNQPGEAQKAIPDGIGPGSQFSRTRSGACSTFTWCKNSPTRHSRPSKRRSQKIPTIQRFIPCWVIF